MPHQSFELANLDFRASANLLKQQIDSLEDLSKGSKRISKLLKLSVNYEVYTKKEVFQTLNEIEIDQQSSCKQARESLIKQAMDVKQYMMHLNIPPITIGNKQSQLNAVKKNKVAPLVAWRKRREFLESEIGNKEEQIKQKHLLLSQIRNKKKFKEQCGRKQNEKLEYQSLDSYPSLSQRNGVRDTKRELESVDHTLIRKKNQFLQLKLFFNSWLDWDKKHYAPIEEVYEWGIALLDDVSKSCSPHPGLSNIVSQPKNELKCFSKGLELQNSQIFELQESLERDLSSRIGKMSLYLNSIFPDHQYGIIMANILQLLVENLGHYLCTVKEIEEANGLLSQQQWAEALNLLLDLGIVKKSHGQDGEVLVQLKVEDSGL